MKRFLRSLAQLAVIAGVSAAHAGAQEDFFRAVDTDNARTVTSLIQRGFDPNAVDEKGQSGLLLALRGGSNQVVGALLAAPATRIDSANPQGETPLMMAALRGQIDTARTLIERGAQVRRDGWTPLHYAASGPELKLVTLLLDRGAMVDAPSPNRTTPLMMAAGYGAQDAAPLLLSRGADPRLRNDKGLNAADFARNAGRESLAKRLDEAAR